MQRNEWLNHSEDLKRMVLVERLTYAEIGKKMGVTRFAIAGVVKRQGLQKNTRRRHFRDIALARKILRKNSEQPKENLVEKRPLQTPANGGMRLIDAERCHCRYIEGDANGADTYICGKQVAPAKVYGDPPQSWCEKHSALVHWRPNT